MAELAAEHRYPVRVYYEDTDAAGIVYYANYLKFAERARTEMLRTIGIGQRELRDQKGVAFAVRRCNVDYMAPAKLDDVLEVRTRITGLRGAAIEAEQIVARDNDQLVRLNIMLVCIGPGGNATRIPKPVLQAFARDQIPLSQKREKHG
ncbi:MAG TPA: tol-pal system-associated acyl-CoA thioesterase [Alphaproteobacteria bacterium]|nr:tol-pal system-associated acyl-CoA thioesterase [Alphaproteobacteria bacterium]